jgi:4-diphosphocytidyl-2-C-methyl-D-erythritol kinase
MMKVLSPAKINLFLEIGNLKDGFHRLASLVDIVTLYDTIEIQESSSNRVIFNPKLDIPSENTVTKSIALIQSLFNVRKTVSIKIFKKIPPGSGLGGGSSNAASTLKSLVKLWNISITEKELIEIGSEIGKDVPLFIHGRRCIMKGFGEKISRVTFKRPLVYYVIIPSLKISTKKIYTYFDNLGLQGNLTESDKKIKLLTESIEKGDISSIESSIDNRLEGAYFDLYKKAREVRNFLQGKTGKKFFASGSGGALFSVFLNRREAEEKTRMLKIAGWTSHIVESIQTS